MRKIEFKIRLSVMIAALMFLAVGMANADSYYQTGESNSYAVIEAGTGSTLTIRFTNDATPIAGSSYSGDLATAGLTEYISTGTYTVQSYTGNTYTLMPKTSTISIKDSTGSTTYMTMLASATKFYSDTGIVEWTITSLNVLNDGGYATLQDMKNAASFTYSMTINTATGLTYNARLDAFAAAPEPAEWVLMIIGLALMGYYLHRKGYLNLQTSPQTYA